MFIILSFDLKLETILKKSYTRLIPPLLGKVEELFLDSTKYQLELPLFQPCLQLQNVNFCFVPKYNFTTRIILQSTAAST